MADRYKVPFEEIELNLNIEGVKIRSKEKESWGIIGQPRAMKALEMGLEIERKGYNIFICGQSGTGRKTALKRILKNYSNKKGKLQDIAFAYNFHNEDMPVPLYFKEGKSKSFKHDLKHFIQQVKQIVKTELSSERYQKKRDNIVTGMEQYENSELNRFDKRLKEKDFQIMQFDDDSSQTADIVPIINDKPVDFDELQDLVIEGVITNDDWKKKREEYYHFIDEMKNLLSNLAERRKLMEEKLTEVQKEIVKTRIETAIFTLKQNYKDDSIQNYLIVLEEDILKNLFLFIEETGEEDGLETEPSDLLRYNINIILDNENTDTKPVIFENHPTYFNLFGGIESQNDPRGESQSNFLMIKPGSLIRAWGGYLILEAKDLLQNEDMWNGLKKVLETGEVQIQPKANALNISTALIKPEPVKVKLKVIILGPENLYDLLFSLDPSITKYFKIIAEFDSSIENNNQTIKETIRFIHDLTKLENMLEPDTESIKEILRYSIRLANRRDRLSARFSEIADLVRESHFAAVKKGSKLIRTKDVLEALESRLYMHNMPEEKLQEMISSNVILIDTSGQAVAKVNGLAVLDRGFFSFGCPMLITAQCGPGKGGILNIERESGLSGEIHDKGVFILEGYLRSKYAPDYALSISASISLEQSYSGIDGDSASSGELYALLSSISGIPLRQDIAVTGSVNQQGDVQPVGGISEKIEGFYKTCIKRGLSGSQGVIIPGRNKLNIVLSDTIVNDIKAGKFHIYAVNTIDEGLEILTGMKSGKRNRKKRYPAGSINSEISGRLKMFSKYSMKSRF